MIQFLRVFSNHNCDIIIILLLLESFFKACVIFVYSFSYLYCIVNFEDFCFHI